MPPPGRPAPGLTGPRGSKDINLLRNGRFISPFDVEAFAERQTLDMLTSHVNRADRLWVCHTRFYVESAADHLSGCGGQEIGRFLQRWAG